MNFTEAFTGMFYTRLEEGDFYNPLEACEEYRIAQDEYEEVRRQTNKRRAEGRKVDVEQVERLINAMNRLFDLQANYIYRTGIQDALTMTRREFVTADLY